MTLSDLRQLARGRYGLEYSTSEDAQFINTFLNKLVNEAHAWFAGVTKCYYNPGMELAAQAAASAGVPHAVALGNTVIQVDERTVRYKTTAGAASTWVRLPLRLYHSLLEQYGALETVATGTPVGFFLHAGATDDNGRKITVVPGPSAQFDLRFGAWVYPPEMTADGDEPELQEAEHYRLIPAICWKMAQLDRSRGRADAPVEMWGAQALDEALELARIIREGTLEFSRSANVGASPLADAERRRQPNLGAGARGGG